MSEECSPTLILLNSAILLISLVGLATFLPPPPSTVQSFWLFPVHLPKTPLQSFVPPKARPLIHIVEAFASRLGVEARIPFALHCLSAPLSPVGFAHKLSMEATSDIGWGTLKYYFVKIP